jgi:hypothetical protein
MSTVCTAQEYVPARHDTVQTILTDYIADESPEWYEELYRVATQIEERAEKKKRMEQNRRDSDEQRQVKQKVQQTLRGTTHTKKQKTTKEYFKHKWKKQYLNKEGNTTTLKPTPEPTATMTPRVKRKQQHTAHKNDQVQSKWFAKWEQYRHTKCKVCEKEGTDENNKLLGCAYVGHRTHEKCDIRQLNSDRKKWNTYQCVGGVEKFKHPTVREEERE